MVTAPSLRSYFGAQETVIEHHAIEKEYVVETRPLGEHEIVEEVKVGRTVAVCHSVATGLGLCVISKGGMQVTNSANKTIVPNLRNGASNTSFVISLNPGLKKPHIMESLTNSGDERCARMVLCGSSRGAVLSCVDGHMPAALGLAVAGLHLAFFVFAHAAAEMLQHASLIVRPVICSWWYGRPMRRHCFGPSANLSRLWTYL